MNYSVASRWFNRVITFLESRDDLPTAYKNQIRAIAGRLARSAEVERRATKERK